MMIDRVACWLDHEDIGTADIVLDLDPRLAVLPEIHHCSTEWNLKLLADRLRQSRVGVSGKDLQAAIH